MFKKFKDKLAEEVKSSPQRLQQFAQAAQAAVTSASSSISDITNNDLFSIGDSDSTSKSQTSTASQQSTFRDMSPIYQGTNQSGSELTETTIMHEDIQRQRRLSNSSLASDISFRLPSYESPMMYHLQSDMEVSASEAEEKGFSGGTANLDRVTKEQLYSAYRRTHDRCKKYKTQYADLARHYKLLERENAKAKNVLVETQDKALRRISELREQCSLEQSAKAHLERALRIEIEEKNMKIHSLNTTLELLQNNPDSSNYDSENNMNQNEKESDMHLINLNDNDQKVSNEENLTTEISLLNNKLEKMEQLMNKYKESLKIVKEKNAQMTTEIQILSNDLEKKSKENEELKSVSKSLMDSRKKNQELNDIIEELQNKCNTYEFTKNKETSLLEINLKSAQEEIMKLQRKIEELRKKEEEYAISLAENKLSIHKELESKETEIKSLKDSLTQAQNEIQSLLVVNNDYKDNIASLEVERLALKSDINNLNITKTEITDLELQLEEFRQKYQLLENSKAKLDEQFKCLQLQMKQETAEKLAMVDRNAYLESRIEQLSHESAKKSSQIHDLETEIESQKSNKREEVKEDDSSLSNEISVWKAKYENLEMEIQDEREELIKLQSEIEKLLRNYESLQKQNMNLVHLNSELEKENTSLHKTIKNYPELQKRLEDVGDKVKDLRKVSHLIANDFETYYTFVKNEGFSVIHDKISLFNDVYLKEMNRNNEKYNELKINYDRSEKELINISHKYEVTRKELQILKDQNNNDKVKIEEYKSDIILLEEKAKSVSTQYEAAMEEINILKNEVDNLKSKIDIEFKQQTSIDESLKTLEAENRNLQHKIAESENIIQVLNSNLIVEQNKYDKEIKNVSAQQQISLEEIAALKSELEELQNKINCDEIQYSKLVDSLKTLETENCSLRDKLRENENDLKQLSLSLQKEKDLCHEKTSETLVLSNNNTILLKDIEEKKNVIINLQENILSLTQENLTLKNLSETISLNVNKLECEMNEVRQSHAEIEKEKNHLNTIIEELEKRQIRETANVGSNTDFIPSEKETNNGGLSANLQQSQYVTEFRTEIAEEKINPEHYSNRLNNSSEDIQVAQKYNILQNEYDTLKEENRRLQSDVEGLQIYLAKISKENSMLTDKLREYFASGENGPEKNETLMNDIEKLKSEILNGKEKIDNLIRENTILVEENLELKDQIQSQSYNTYPDNKFLQNSNNADGESRDYKDKYQCLLDEKIRLEKRLSDIQQMNQTVDDNMHQMQVNNEKLRLSNEKLERRLDEALVSLRHLHSLQENTELEYLRNILYEYLTGSGTHSLTLAKVLAAVVKFSDSQTDLVLQKERERQGFLRQMGLL